MDAKTIRECHKQLQAVAISDPKELSDYIREAMTRRAKKRKAAQRAVRVPKE
jgi:hypothetical protein